MILSELLFQTLNGKLRVNRVYFSGLKQYLTKESHL